VKMLLCLPMAVSDWWMLVGKWSFRLMVPASERSEFATAVATFVHSE
jgi:hypothetical protein